MNSGNPLRWLGALLLSVAVAGGSSNAFSQTLAKNVPAGVQVSHDRGLVDPTTAIHITVHLTLKDKAGFDKAVDALYDPASPTYHKWMTDEDFRKYAPAESQRTAVRDELVKHGLTIESTDKWGFTIRARGSVANVERAFNTEIHEFEHNGQIYRAQVRDARLSGPAADYIHVVSGIESHPMRPMLVRAKNLKTGKTLAPIKLTQAKAVAFPPGSTTECLSAPATDKFGTAPTTATYHGTQYMAKFPSTVACDYLPSQLQAALGLNAVYAAGYKGTGQSIVLIEGYGYPTLESDANLFYKLANLPPLTSKNFKIVYPEGKPNPKLGVLTGWDGEIALDMDSAHTIAPGARIVVVATNGQDNEDFQNSILYAVQNNLGNQLSNSYGEDLDLIAGPLEQVSWDNVLELASALGVSVNFSTGDSGDNGLGTPVGAPSLPSVAPHATAVGGTSILNDVYHSGKKITTSWGTTANFLEIGGGAENPPTGGAFLVFGGGGGESVYWHKPAWQKNLPGTHRQVPDVSALGDPYTGFPIVVTISGTPYVEYGVGGTSLSCPIFSGFWALANEKSGKALGQAAPLIAALPYGGVQDVLPSTDSTSHNVAGSVTDSKGTTKYSADELLSPALYGNKYFTSTLYPLDATDVLDFAFGVDSSLTVHKGWDNATGFGTPYGLTFINAVTAHK